MKTSEALIFAPFSCSFVIKTVYAGCLASQVIISHDGKRMENNRRANLLTVGRRKDVAERFHRPDLEGDLREIQRHRAVLGGLATQFSYKFFFKIMIILHNPVHKEGHCNRQPPWKII